jgi:hypothetical protein
MTRKISANGQALHRAMARRIDSGGADQPPSAAEAALIEERRLLKEERDQRKAQPRHRPSALDRLVRTHHPEPKAKPKVRNAAHAAGETSKPKPHKTRAEKSAEKAAALEAARKTPKKPAK